MVNISSLRSEGFFFNLKIVISLDEFICKEANDENPVGSEALHNISIRRRVPSTPSSCTCLRHSRVQIKAMTSEVCTNDLGVFIQELISP